MKRPLRPLQPRTLTPRDSAMSRPRRHGAPPYNPSHWYDFGRVRSPRQQERRRHYVAEPTQ